MLAVDDNDNIYVTFNSADGTKFFVSRSTDNGRSWKQYPFIGSVFSCVPRDIAVDHLGNVWLLWLSWGNEFAPAILNLSKSGYQTVVACAVGYRSPNDKYASIKKVRFEENEVVEIR